MGAHIGRGEIIAVATCQPLRQCLPPRRKIIDAELAAQRLGLSCRLCVERCPGGVGDPIDCIEEASYAGGVDQGGLTHRIHNISAGSGKPWIVGAKQGPGEIDQQCAIGNAGLAGRAARGDGLKVERLA